MADLFRAHNWDPNIKSNGRSVAVGLTQRKANKLGMWLGTWFRMSFGDDDDAYCARARRSRRSSSRHRCSCCCRCTRAHRLLRRARDIEGEHVYNAARSFSFSSVSISLYSHKLSLLILYYIYLSRCFIPFSVFCLNMFCMRLCARAMYLSLSLTYILLFISRISLSLTVSLL